MKYRKVQLVEVQEVQDQVQVQCGTGSKCTYRKVEVQAQGREVQNGRRAQLVEVQDQVKGVQESTGREVQNAGRTQRRRSCFGLLLQVSGNPLKVVHMKGRVRKISTMNWNSETIRNDQKRKMSGAKL